LSHVLEISPVTRHEGHSKLVLKIDNEGIIERGDWVSITPVRGIERLAIGKPMESVPKIASRVCGICPVVLSLASTESMEASIRCYIPNNARILRTILLYANRLHNLALHNLLILPDFYLPRTDRKINPYSAEEPIRTAALRIQKLRQIGQTIAGIVGGEAIHPSSVRIGGIRSNISRQAKDKISSLAKESIPLAREQMEFMVSVLRDFQGRDSISVGSQNVILPGNLGFHSQGYMATSPVYGSSSLDENPTWDPQRFTEVRPYDWYMGEVTVDVADPDYPFGGTSPVGTMANPQTESCAALPLYDGQPVEVGPRARSARFRGNAEKGTIGQHIARQLEYMDNVHTMTEFIDALNVQGKVLADRIPDGDGSPGWALNEAPRGTNVHFARVKDGKVQSYSMIVPTTWNIPTASLALRGAPWQLAEMVVRAFDPCVSCATHMLVIDQNGKTVEERLV